MSDSLMNRIERLERAVGATGILYLRADSPGASGPSPAEILPHQRAVYVYTGIPHPDDHGTIPAAVADCGAA